MHTLSDLLTCNTTLIPIAVPSHWCLPADHESVPRARRLVAGVLPIHLPQVVFGQPTHEGMGEELGDTLSLMTSELVTNAVTHAPTYERVIELTLWRADGMLWLAVSDCGEVFPVRSPRPPDPVAPVYPDPESDHGRGLYLVEALADVWTVIARPTVGKSVVAGLRLR